MNTAELHTGPNGPLHVLNLTMDWTPKRIYWFKGNVGSVRGDHALMTVEQLVVVLRGSLRLEVEMSGNKTVTLLEIGQSAEIPPQSWRTLTMQSPDTIVMVLASDLYSADHYVRHRPEWIDRGGH